MADAGSSASNTVDVPDRFIPCLVAGLAYYVAMKHPEAAARVQLLKAAYEELFDQAAEEDRVKTSARFVPNVMGY